MHPISYWKTLVFSTIRNTSGVNLTPEVFPVLGFA